MWKKRMGPIALALLIFLASTGAALTPGIAGAEADPTLAPMLDELLSVGDEAQGDAAAPDTPEPVQVPDKPRIGITVANMNTASYAIVKGILPTGAYITGVQPDSLAEKAGLLAGDIVVEMDGVAIATTAQMAGILQEKDAGDTVTIKVYRVEGIENAQSYSDIEDGEYVEVSIELTPLEEIEL